MIRLTKRQENIVENIVIATDVSYITSGLGGYLKARSELIKIADKLGISLNERYTGEYNSNTSIIMEIRRAAANALIRGKR